MNWESDFYSFWDDFIKKWWDAKAEPQDAVTQSFHRECGICLDELPEPYLGSHSEAKAVVINYNPGRADPNEKVKYYSENNNARSLIYHFAHEHKKSYGDYLNKWSPLSSALDNANSQVPGVEWWRNRFRWIEHFAGQFQGCNDKEKIRRENVFALEICPYHSRRWCGEIDDQTLIDHVRDKVIVPAACTAIENSLPCVICAGRMIGETLKNKFGLRTIKKWGSTDKSETNNLAGWPKGRKGNAALRCYEILELDGRKNSLFVKDIGVCKVLFLVLSVVGSNRLPGRRFFGFESKNVVEFIHQYKSKAKGGK